MQIFQASKGLLPSKQAAVPYRSVTPAVGVCELSLPHEPTAICAGCTRAPPVPETGGISGPDLNHPPTHTHTPNLEHLKQTKIIVLRSFYYKEKYVRYFIYIYICRFNETSKVVIVSRKQKAEYHA